MMEDGQRNRCLANPSSAYKSDRCEGFCEANDPFDKPVASKTGPRGRGRRFSERAGFKCKAVDSLEVKAADLV